MIWKVFLNGDVIVLAAANSLLSDDAGKVSLVTQLKQSKISSLQKPVLIPLNIHALKKDFSVQNHWSGLLISIDKNYNAYNAIYLDPIGHGIGKSLSVEISKCLGINHFNIKQPLNHNEAEIIATKDDIKYSTHKSLQFFDLCTNESDDWNFWSYNGNQDDCGPFLVFLFSLIIDNENLPIFNKLTKESSHSIAEIIRGSKGMNRKQLIENVMALLMQYQ